MKIVLVLACAMAILATEALARDGRTPDLANLLADTAGTEGLIAADCS